MCIDLTAIVERKKYYQCLRISLYKSQKEATVSNGARGLEGAVMGKSGAVVCLWAGEPVKRVPSVYETHQLHTCELFTFAYVLYWNKRFQK